MIRLFIALPLEKKVEDRLNDIITQLEPYGGRVKYVNPKNIHLTLKFLGNTEPELVEKIIKNIDQVAAKFNSVKTNLSHIGTFPDWKHPRVIWIGIDETKEILPKIAKQIEIAMKPLGWEKIDKKFRAHLTLGRIKDNRDLEDLINFAKNYKIEPIPLKFDRITLFQSTLTNRGPFYKILHEAKLGERFG